MLVKMNGHASPSFDLIGGGLQGSLIGQLLNFIASDDVAEDIPEEIKYRYIDDLSALEAITIQGTLVEYDVCQNVSSYLAPGQLFLPPDTFKLQMYNDTLFQRSNSNKVVINQQKSNYMVISRSNQDIATNLNINGELLVRKHTNVHLGMHITDRLCWKKAYF